MLAVLKIIVQNTTYLLVSTISELGIHESFNLHYYSFKANC